MFGNLNKKDLCVIVILACFCGYILKLFIDETISFYIHPRYTIFAVIMSSIGLTLLVAGIVSNWGKQRQKAQPFSFNLVDIIVVAILILALTVPAQTLSSKMTGRKSLNVPTYNQATNSHQFNECIEIHDWSIQVWVRVLSQYPARCFQDKPIALTGFVIESPADPLPSNMYYLGRVIISCCVVDARPYALPVHLGNFNSYPTNTWLEIKGVLRETKINGTIQMTIHPTSVNKIDALDRPYEYFTAQAQN